MFKTLEVLKIEDQHSEYVKSKTPGRLYWILSNVCIDDPEHVQHIHQISQSIESQK